MSLYLRMLHQENGVTKAELNRRYPQYATRSIYRHASKQIEEGPIVRKKSSGRPKKLSARDERLVISTLKRLRKEVAGFTAKRIQEEANLTHVSTRTIHRVLHRHGYKYLQSRKKGLVSAKDKRLRLAFARNAKKFEEGFWRNKIKLYFDGVGFAHKGNPFAEARCTANMAWRKRKEGLQRTTKGKKEGSGGKMANFFVGIAHGKGVVLCKQYEWKVTGATFADFATRTFPSAFEKCDAEPEGSLFLQDGDPRQNSAVAKKAFESMGCKVFGIPARSPDLNPIENIFHLVRKKLKEDALAKKIHHESYKEFAKRVAETISNFPADVISKTIELMEQRIDMVIASKGERIKY